MGTNLFYFIIGNFSGDYLGVNKTLSLTHGALNGYNWIWKAEWLRDNIQFNKVKGAEVQSGIHIIHLLLYSSITISSQTITFWIFLCQGCNPITNVFHISYSFSYFLLSQNLLKMTVFFFNLKVKSLCSFLKVTKKYMIVQVQI